MTKPNNLEIEDVTSKKYKEYIGRQNGGGSSFLDFIGRHPGLRVGLVGVGVVGISSLLASCTAEQPPAVVEELPGSAGLPSEVLGESNGVEEGQTDVSNNPETEQSEFMTQMEKALAGYDNGNGQDTLVEFEGATLDEVKKFARQLENMGFNDIIGEGDDGVVHRFIARSSNGWEVELGIAVFEDANGGGHITFDDRNAQKGSGGGNVAVAGAERGDGDVLSYEVMSQQIEGLTQEDYNRLMEIYLSSDDKKVTSFYNFAKGMLEQESVQAP